MQRLKKAIGGSGRHLPTESRGDLSASASPARKGGGKKGSGAAAGGGGKKRDRRQSAAEANPNSFSALNPHANSRKLSAVGPGSGSGNGGGGGGGGGGSSSYNSSSSSSSNSSALESLELSEFRHGEDTVALHHELREAKRRIVVLEEKLERVLDLVSRPEFRAAMDAQAGVVKKQRTLGPANTIRGFVSLKKHRFQQDGFDLDLSYIGADRRLIAMGFPTSGIEAVYRNPLSETVRFFKTYHHGRFRVYNLCAEPRRQYDPARFEAEGGSVATYPFLDHNACALALLRPFCEDVHAFLGAVRAFLPACPASRPPLLAMA
jgi:hypothetical protein